MDSAYEAVDSMESTNDSALLTNWWEIVKSSYEGKCYKKIKCFKSLILNYFYF